VQFVDKKFCPQMAQMDTNESSHEMIKVNCLYLSVPFRACPVESLPISHRVFRGQTLLVQRKEF